MLLKTLKFVDLQEGNGSTALWKVEIQEREACLPAQKGKTSHKESTKICMRMSLFTDNTKTAEPK
jgi:hypothetical protein